MLDKIQNKLNNEKILYLTIGIISSAVFCLIYGVKVLNPTYTDWLMVGGDLSQHYLGWVAYRKSAWHFPFGLVDTLTYPYLSSVIFSDSIPLFAIIFKILSPILPDNFQYFGLWGIMCFILQGLLSARIIKNFTDNKLAILLASILFLFTPVMIWRMYAHTSLAGQWILLLALDLLFNYEKYSNNYIYIYIYISIIGFLSTATHMYITLMCGIMVVGYCILDICKTKKILKSIKVLCVFIFSILITTYLFGGFSTGAGPSVGGLGFYSTNLNAFFNPQGWSVFFKDHPLATGGQYEGFAYLGAGIIMLLVIGLISLLGKEDLISSIKNNWQVIVSILCVLIIALLFAASNVITIGDITLLSISFPDIINKCWSVFRASGRVSWICVYIIMLTCIIICLKTFNKKTIIVTLLFALFFQTYDIRKQIEQRHTNFSSEVIYNSPLSNEKFWNEVKELNIKHIVYGNFGGIDQGYQFGLTDYALKNNMTTSNFYLARWFDTSGARIDALNNVIDDNLYIFSEGDLEELSNYNLHYYKIDGYIFGYCKTIDEFKELEV